jgi:DNA-binding CsgD family transcriptional regulator
MSNSNNIKNLPGLLSVRYRHLIKSLVEPLKNNEHFSSIAVAIVLPSNRFAWLSSLPKLALQMSKLGFYRGDLLLKHEFCQQHRLVFPEDYLSSDDLSKKILAVLESYQCYRAYCFLRSCEDCCIVVSYNTKRNISSKIELYRKTIDEIERFTCHFLNETLFIFCEALPELAHGRFYQDANFRERVIKDRQLHRSSSILQPHEVDVLYWSARGKTAEEIGIILNLSFHTINTYRKLAIEKLNAANITHAVYLALTQHIIV